MSTRLPIACILIATAIWIGASLGTGSPGITWDEPWYVQAGAFYTGLWNAREAGLASAWAVNHEHPPLAKILMGMGEWVAVLFLERPDAILLGARATVMLLFGILLIGVWRLVEPCGRHAAAAAVLFCAACPRLVGHAHLATLDLPLACAWIWTLAALARALPGLPATAHESRTQRLWFALAIAFFACATLTKFAGVLLLGVVAAWGVLQRVLSPPRLSLRALALLLFGMGAAACLLHALAWPWLWEDTAARLATYLAAGTQHRMCPVLYRGLVYGADWKTDGPPWHYAPVMPALSTPAWVSAGACLARGGRAIEAARTRAASTHARLFLLLACGAAALPAATMLPGGVAYDGVRLFLPAVPLLAALAACGWSWACGCVAQRATGPRTGRLLAWVPVILALACTGFRLLAVEDDLAYYTLAARGPAGAQALGMETCYWATGATRERLQDLLCGDTDAPARRLRFVGFGSVAPRFLQGIGWLPEGVEIVEDDSWDCRILLRRASLTDVQRLQTEPGIPLARARVWPADPVPTMLVTRSWAPR